MQVEKSTGAVEVGVTNTGQSLCVCVLHGDGSLDMCTPKLGEDFFLGDETKSAVLSYSNKKPWATAML